MTGGNEGNGRQASAVQPGPGPAARNRPARAGRWLTTLLLASVFAWAAPVGAAAGSPSASADAKKPAGNQVAKARAGGKKVARSSHSGKKAAKRKDSGKKVAARKKSSSAGTSRVRSAKVSSRAGVRKVSTRKARKGGVARPTRTVAARPTMGKVFGLHDAEDPLSLRSSVALVMNPRRDRVLYEKNSGQVLPIASITKLMTAMVTIDADLPMREMIEITREDIDRERGSSSRLAVRTRLSRAELLQLALMSSENRAAHALGRTYPGGLTRFVSAMNAKAKMLGMFDTQFVEPTGLSSANVSTAQDLARLVLASTEYGRIREDSTRASLRVDTGYRQLTFRTTNSLINRKDWEIGLQKTGFISEAGRCLVMQVRMDGEPIVIVLLDSSGRYSRFADARRIRRWVEKNTDTVHAAAAMPAG
ncbi:MAG: D-alanyl-D-alanine endopeptidase [Burkholderiaceae bacterium]